MYSATKFGRLVVTLVLGLVDLCMHVFCFSFVHRERFMNITTSEVDIRYLKPSAKYTFHVAAYGLQGVSPNSASVVVQTSASGMESPNILLGMSSIGLKKVF